MMGWPIIFLVSSNSTSFVPVAYYLEDIFPASCGPQLSSHLSTVTGKFQGEPVRATQAIVDKTAKGLLKIVPGICSQSDSLVFVAILSENP